MYLQSQKNFLRLRWTYDNNYILWEIEYNIHKYIRNIKVRLLNIIPYNSLQMNLYAIEN